VKITGKTEVVGLFGYPVRHTASPAFQNAGFEAAGLDWVYVAFEVHPNDLGRAIDGIVALGFRGINLTIPHKQAAIEYLDELSPEAEIIGAVNTVDIRDGRLKGYNTDGQGFVRSIKEESDFDLADKRIFLMGSGGAGRGVAVQAALDGASEICVCDCEESRSQSAVSLIDSRIRPGVARFVPFNSLSIREGVQRCELFVDATPLGMKLDDPTSIDADWLNSSCLVYDLVYDPPETPLLRAARQRGCRTQNGLGMLLYQGCIAFETWTGVSAPVAEMRRALEEAVLHKG
jgi:shikimate dehydrogenase